jgi:hypothetical protein
MKNLILFVLLGSLGLAGPPQLRTRTSFNFGGQGDNPISFFMNSNGETFVGGIKDTWIGHNSAITKISNSGVQKWIVTDSSKVSTSMVCGESFIYWTTYKTGSIRKTDTEGKEIWNIKISDSWTSVFIYNGLPVITIDGNLPKIVFLDGDGNITKELPIPSIYMQGSWLPKLQGKNLWLFGTPFSVPGTSVLVINLETGEKLWEKWFEKTIRTTGSVDTAGNGYLTVSWHPTTDSSYVMEIMTVKLDSLGNEIWRNNWLPRSSVETNQENWINNSTVSLEKNLLVICGGIQEGNTHSWEKDAYITGFDATTGKLAWFKIINYANNHLESTIGVQFTDSKKLAVMGVSHCPPSFDPPSKIFVETYEVGAILGVENLIQPPAEFRLEQNYPNPFNPNTNIRYSIGSKQHVKLTIYDLLGREVSTLVNREQEAGSHEVNFNAANLPSGTYLYRLQTADRVETKKMVLLK